MPDIVIDHIKILSHFLNNFCSATYNKLNDFKYLFPLIILTHQMIFCFSYHCSSDFFNIKVSYIRCKFANIYGHLLEQRIIFQKHQNPIFILIQFMPDIFYEISLPCIWRISEEKISHA